MFRDGFETPPGPVLYLPFDGDTTDYSPSGTDGINSGATLTTDRSGAPDSAYHFNNTGTQIYVPDTASLDVIELTLSFWFNVSSLDSYREVVNKIGLNGNISFGAEYRQGDELVIWNRALSKTEVASLYLNGGKP